MGLYCSHDAFRGAYSAFNRFRQFVCAMCQGSFPPHKYADGGWSCYDGRFFHFKPGETEHFDKLPGGVLHPEMFYLDDKYSRDKFPGLYIFLQHSDCDGFISPGDLSLVIKDLEMVLGMAQKGGISGNAQEILDFPGNHNEAAGGMIAVLERFIKGCKKAKRTAKGLRFE